MELFNLTIDILGMVAFSVSGVMLAMNKKLDIFGVFIIAFVTSVGGGTLRDVLIGDKPVFWLQENIYMYSIIGSVIVAIIFRDQLKYLRKSLFLFDTIGIGLYTMVGIQKGLSYGLEPIMCIGLGTITASFGGVIRDILCNEIPVIFRKEVYATACLCGGFGYFLLEKLPIDAAYPYIGGIVIVISIRLLAVRFKIALPNIYKSSVA
ncbi:trimeric intracellular cation channel family protein [Cellulophaga baltica]|uniref:trimeric intracellular cation channel family protein n=1 Tax=Cellulophaga TaxID=104264 RepID=UPI001C07D924|nr:MULTISPECIES: trimeric intracellular cation channel family protein [Cellulophaga]MBU2994916.1 trimeric intracellular cation channel family protein [Cellulophaga baltica]MDO6766310.1 trimeric intracellular cation channel family protein [Cellulophaga sp. 1_MG-2023]